MRTEKAFEKITQLGQELLLDPNPAVSHLGAAILTFPISAAEDEDDVRELLHLVFTFARVKAEQKEAIQNLLNPKED